MTERPILMSAPMVRAILEGTKTQTRRAVRIPAGYVMSERDDGTLWPWYASHAQGDTESPWLRCPYGEVGDTLWVRETWGVGCRPDPYDGWVDGIEYRADEAYLVDEHDMLWLYPFRDGFPTEISERSGWRPSIHMPRWASRITLRASVVLRQQRDGIAHAILALTPEDIASITQEHEHG